MVQLAIEAADASVAREHRESGSRHVQYGTVACCCTSAGQTVTERHDKNPAFGGSPCVLRLDDQLFAPLRAKSAADEALEGAAGSRVHPSWNPPRQIGQPSCPYG